MQCWISQLMAGAAFCACAVVIVRRWLAPWTWWLGRLAMCWARYAFLRCGFGSGGHTSPRTSTCPCCNGVDFDGMVGRWAVVTGCTDGIGKEYAIQLADRGLNVVLISRNEEKLQAVAQIIHGRHVDDGVRTRIIVANLSSSGGTVSLSDTYEAVRRGLAGLDVALLVNNAAVSYVWPERLLDMPPCCPAQGPCDPLRDVVECNALGPVAMCRIVMPLMATDDEIRGQDACHGRTDRESWDTDGNSSRTTRGGVVINVASASAYLPSPLLAVYAATKAFVEKFSTDLATEYNDEKKKSPLIAVRCLTTGFVATKMSRLRAGGGWSFVPRSRVYACHSLRSLGCHCGCRLSRELDRKHTDWTRKGDGMGWLACVVSTVFDSPSSPCSTGTSGIVTSGYLPHTLMIFMVSAVQWVLGDAYVSNAVERFMRYGRERMMRSDAEKANKQKTLIIRRSEFEKQQ